ncbi:metallophosphoesterase family protein [Thiovibrio frasassiensis]|jgi:DNA repair exonuclease SbcCD nuclease subunit|uniref:DNA repair exonuclease n=1 Tax=Thiovibrio frasassiensis TaxID=2984131 RepID=A0A9X4MI38_9BACT|nr:DNA repair exonuclease [Thiovibrio frasassiensis]MDG4476763.1 DNA repair exonuclease [Thiovibrio frasassiensis]
MFTFLHAADIHLDSPLRGLEAYADAPVEQLRQATRRAFDNLIDLAIEERVAFVLLAGDLYDGDWKDYNTGLFFINRVSRLRKANIRVFMVSGNHDAASQITKALQLPDNVHLFSTKQPGTVTIEALGVALHGQGYHARGLVENIARNFPQPLPHYLNIGLLHTSLTGRQGHEPYAPCSLDDLLAKGYDYWALGHIHKREEVADSPWIVFPGNIQGRHIHETGAKGATLVRVEEGRIAAVEHRELDVLRWSLCQVDLTNCATKDLAIEAIRQGMESEEGRADGRPLALRLQLTGESPVHAELHRDAVPLTEEFRSLAVGLGEIWLEKVEFATRRPVALSGDPMGLGPETPLADLVQAVDRFAFQPGSIKEQIPEIAEMLNKLPPELLHEGGLIGDDSSEWAASLREEVKEMLIAKLLGQGGGR